MNTKSKNSLKLFVVATALSAVAAYVYFSKTAPRRIANETNETKNLTESQKEKWSVTESFQIRQTNESLQIDVPHLVDLCASNTMIDFELSAYEVNIAGENPKIHLKISCLAALQAQQTHFDFSYADLISLHEAKLIKSNIGEISTELVYTDEKFPTKWNLRQISIEGPNGFQITPFEIQKVFGNNFEFELNP